MKHIQLVFIILVFISCRKDEKFEPIQPQEPDSLGNDVVVYPQLPEVLFDYEGTEIPDHILNDPLLNLLNTLNGPNTVTNEGATLGRVLFYDVQLSANNTISCGSCHHQDKAFTDGLAFSPGFEGGLTSRNTMSISNTDFQRRFFWDERANNIEDQVLMPIENAIEMGMDLDSLPGKLSKIPYYPSLFNAAFGDSLITLERIQLALAQFVKSIRSFTSKYDIGVTNNFVDFTEEELHGKNVYFSGFARCNNCHTTQNFGGVTNEINGLDVTYADNGIGGITLQPSDMGNFKTVSLRNIELTGPYMHDGRFETLEEVIEFYVSGIQPHPFLDDRLTVDMQIGGTPLEIGLSEYSKTSLIAFLKTLTDWPLVTDPKFSDPFPH